MMNKKKITLKKFEKLDSKFEYIKRFIPKNGLLLTEKCVLTLAKKIISKYKRDKQYYLGRAFYHILLVIMENDIGAAIYISTFTWNSASCQQHAIKFMEACKHETNK